MKLAFIAMSVVVIGLVSVGGSPRSAEAATCAYTLGFKALHDFIPATVGGCLVDEHHNPINGDGLQETTGPIGASGLLVWRKADNWTAFTDGYHTWISGPFGLQERLNTQRFPWESDYSPPVVAAPAIIPAPAVVPQTTCSSSQSDQALLGGDIIWWQNVYVPPGVGLYGNITTYGSDQTVGVSIQDTYGSVLVGNRWITGSGLFWDASHPGWERIVVANPVGAYAKNIVVNWHMCTFVR